MTRILAATMLVVLAGAPALAAAPAAKPAAAAPAADAALAAIRQDLGVAQRELEGVPADQDKGGHFKVAAGLVRQAIAELEPLTGKAALPAPKKPGHAQTAIATLNDVQRRVKAHPAKGPARMKGHALIMKAIDEIMRGQAKNF